MSATMAGVAGPTPNFGPIGNKSSHPRRERMKHYRSGIFLLIWTLGRVILPIGNMKHTPKTVGELVKCTRKSVGVTQKDLAMTSGTGLRFIIEMEQGKPTCQLGKVLTVLQTLGIKIELVPPPNDKNGI
jgi:HTH-type transcriptional regulator / antitoxin HipB